MKSAYYKRNNSYSRSFNAQQAENAGRYSASKFKTIYGIDPRRIVTSSEWHHVSKFANAVDYYDIERVMQALAEMPYNERKTYLKKGSRFYLYWIENRAYYLRKKQTPTDFEQKNMLKENQMYKVIRNTYYGENISNYEIVVADNATNKHIFHAVKKAYNTAAHFAQKNNVSTASKINIAKNINKFSIPNWYVTLENGKPVTARVLLNDFQEGIDAGLKNEPPIYYDLDVTDYQFNISKRGGRYYFEKTNS